MNSRRLCSLLLALSFAPGATLVSCSKEEQKEPTTKVASIKKKAEVKPKVPLTFKPSGKEKQHLAKMAKSIKPGFPRFLARDSKNKSNAKLFTYMAATASAPERIVAALAAMSSAYGAGKNLAKVDADFAAVVSYHLKSANPLILDRALRAANVGLRATEPNPALVADVVQVATQSSDGPARQGALNALRGLPKSARSEGIATLFASSLESKDTSVLASALQGLEGSASVIKDPAPLVERALVLSKHEDPAVRGRAISALGALGAGSSEAASSVLAGLTDKEGFVRGQACLALGTLGRAGAIHALMPLVDDMQSAVVVQGGWKGLDGKPGIQRHGGPLFDAVAAAALQAISQLAGDSAKLPMLTAKSSAEQVKHAAEAAKTWYSSAKKDLPAESSVTVAAKVVPGSTKAVAATGTTKPSAATPAIAKSPAATPAAVKPAAATPVAKPPAAPPAAGAQ